MVLSLRVKEVVRARFPQASPRTIVCLSMTFSLAIELSQFYHAPLDRLDPPDNFGRADPGLRVPLKRPGVLRLGSRFGRYDRDCGNRPQGEARVTIHGAFSCH